MEPERAHNLALALLPAAARPPLKNILFGDVQQRPRKVMGIRFPNPVGLAAGLDKDGRCIDGLAALGFGFIEVGTVTPRAQAGNPKPRMFRVPEAQAIINRMGFNNGGVEQLWRTCAARVTTACSESISARTRTRRWRRRTGLSCLFARCLCRGQLCHASTSPLRTRRGSEHCSTVSRSSVCSASLKSEQSRLAEKHGRYVPLVIKIAPDLSDEEIRHLATAFVDQGMDGVIATNTTNARAGVSGLVHGDEIGGMSGAPLRERALDVLECLCDALGGALPVIAVGGIMSSEDAQERFASGASLVQIYTGLVYRGPMLIREIAAAAPQGGVCNSEPTGTGSH